MNEQRQRRLFALVALLTAFGALGWISMSTMGEDIVYYLSPTELNAKGDAAFGATIRLGGMVEDGSVDWNPDEQRLAFRVTDGMESVPVVGKGAPPQMFREGIGAIIEGKLGPDGVFRSNQVIIKHDNGYKAPEEGETPAEIYEQLRAQEGT